MRILVWVGGNVVALKERVSRLETKVELLEHYMREKSNVTCELLFDIYTRLQMYFPNSPVFLTTRCDEVWIDVGTKLSVEEAIAQMDKFDEEFWIDADAGSRINIGIRYL